MRVQSFACRLRGESHESTICATSPGKAKRIYFDSVSESLPDLEFTEIRVRRLGGPVTTADFQRTADDRGVPFARVGMLVSVGGERGVIIGNNSSGNFDILFDDDSKYQGETLNCHPSWKMTYFADDGSVIKSFE